MNAPLTKQQMFDAALQGVRGQGYRRSMIDSGCAYVGSGGTHCAVGHMLTPEIHARLVQDGQNRTGVFSLCRNVTSVRARLLGDLDPADLDPADIDADVIMEFLRALQNCHDTMGNQGGSGIPGTPDDFERVMSVIAKGHGLVYTPPGATA